MAGGIVINIMGMAQSERLPESTSAGTRVAAVLCLIGGACLLALAGLSMFKWLGADDPADSGFGADSVFGAVFLAVFAGFAGLLLYAGHLLWWRGRRLPARMLAGFVLVVTGIGLVAEFAESGGREVSAFVGWIGAMAWAIAILVAIAQRRR